ncbi:MAG TPA: LacI family DNA-binding transcriptional regulator [Bauldia sp.]|nr:LacI family DNA-binding transcriptional regulator [Bauldia sp.]
MDREASTATAAGTAGRDVDGAARRARVEDVARLAGVSTATVDRVLNRRPGVRAKTVDRVVAAAIELDYIGEGDRQRIATGPPMQLAFILPDGTNRYLSGFARMVAGASEQIASYNMRARVELIKSFEPRLLARQLERCGRDFDAVAFMALEHPAVREAVEGLAEKGIPSVTLISDIANSRRVAYVGLDNRAAGRTAGYLMSRFLRRRPAKVAVIAGSLSYRAHEEREMGFMHIFQEIDPEIEMVGVREGRDDEAMTYRQVRMLLASYPDLAGIYSVGGGVTGLARAVHEARRAEEIVLIGHALTQETRTLLVDGTFDAILNQNAPTSLTSCLGIFANIRAGRETTAGIPPPSCDVLLPENLPAG